MVRKGRISRVSVFLLFVCLIGMSSISYSQNQNTESVDLLNDRTMESINNTVVRETITLFVRVDGFDSDMDGIEDIYELPGLEHDFDNDGGLPDNNSNPVIPNTGEDRYDHDSDNDGIEDWPWGNDTVLIQPITRSVRLIPFSHYFVIYIDEPNNVLPNAYASDIMYFDLYLNDVSDGEHTIYLQYVIEEGQNINITTYEFHIEVRKKTYGPPLWFFWIMGVIMMFLIVMIIVVYIMTKKPKLM